jgi:replicative DNA helicase
LTGRQLPHNADAERSLIGGVLLDGASLAEASALVRPADFYVPANSKVWGAMLQLEARGRPVDRVSVVEELRSTGELEAAGGAEYVEALDKEVPTSSNLTYYAKIVSSKAQARELIRVSGEIGVLAYEQQGEVAELLDLAESRTMAIRADRDRSGGGFTHGKQLLASTFKSLEDRYNRGEEITGIATGLADFDQLTAGLQLGDLVIVAARPSMGKTALALDWIREVALVTKYRDQGCTTGIFSLEMPKEQLMLRILSAQSGVDSARMRTGKLIESDWGKLAMAAGPIGQAEIHVDDSAGITIMELRARARRLKALASKTDKPLRMIVVDYLQLMGGEGESREQVVAGISRQLKLLAKELEVVVVALSQLSRSCESRTDKRPMLSDLRESGAIEQDADVVVFLYRHEVYDREDQDSQGKAELIIGKQRNGPIGFAHVAFVNHLSSFRNLQRGAQQ